jgi:hypothetical protein
MNSACAARAKLRWSATRWNARSCREVNSISEFLSSIEQNSELVVDGAEA